jgi:hypothetical protein
MRANTIPPHLEPEYGLNDERFLENPSTNSSNSLFETGATLIHEIETLEETESETPGK